MKLNELILKGRDRYDYIDVNNELDWWNHVKYDKVVDAGLPGITLGIKKNFAPGLHSSQAKKYKYSVIILENNEPIGFVFFKEPDRFTSTKRIPADTYTPHSGIKHKHTGKGYISAVYKWFLNAGHNLITGHEQTAASNALWKSLSRSYELQFISNDGNVISDITPEKAQHQDTRMLLLGKGRKKLEELLTKRIPYEVTYETPKYFSTEAKIGKRKVKFTASKFMNSWDVEFSEVDSDDHRTYAATGSGAAFDVGAFVISSMQEFIDRHQPNEIEFSADSPTRKAIYRRAMKTHFKNYKETDKTVYGNDLPKDMLRFVK